MSSVRLVGAFAHEWEKSVLAYTGTSASVSPHAEAGRLADLPAEEQLIGAVFKTAACVVHTAESGSIRSQLL